MPPRLHPDSWRDLRQLHKLHGSFDLKKALDHLDYLDQRPTQPAMNPAGTVYPKPSRTSEQRYENVRAQKTRKRRERDKGPVTILNKE